MGIVNAVLMVSNKTLPRWVLDAASIAQWGRLEDTQSVGDIEDPATIDAIGAAWLAARSQPLVSHTVETHNTTGATAGVDYVESDTVTAPDGPARVMELAFTLAPTGRFTPVPGLNSPLEEQLRRTEAKLDRMIAAAGGASPVSNPATQTGSNIVAGRRDAWVIDRWSWRDKGELDPDYWDPEEEEVRAWQPATLEEPTVATSIVVDCDFDEATGPSTFIYLVNGVAPLSIPALGGLPITVTVPADSGHGEIPLFGATFLNKNDRPSVACIVNGGHTNGSITMNGANPE